MKRFLFYGIVAISLIFYTLLFSGLMGLTGDHGLVNDGGAHIMHHSGALLILLFVIGGIVMQFFSSEKQIAGFRLLSAVLFGFLIMAFIVGDPDNYGGNKAIFDLAFLIFIIPAVIVWTLHPSKKN